MIQLRQIAEQLGLRSGESVIPLGYLSDVTYYSLLSRACGAMAEANAGGKAVGFPVYEALVSGVPLSALTSRSSVSRWLARKGPSCGSTT